MQAGQSGVRSLLHHLPVGWCWRKNHLPWVRILLHHLRFWSAGGPPLQFCLSDCSHSWVDQTPLARTRRCHRRTSNCESVFPVHFGPVFKTNNRIMLRQLKMYSKPTIEEYYRRSFYFIETKMHEYEIENIDYLYSCICNFAYFPGLVGLPWLFMEISVKLQCGFSRCEIHKGVAEIASIPEKYRTRVLVFIFIIYTRAFNDEWKT